jgi:hypothetical protein
MVLCETIDQQVVDYCSFRGCKCGVLGLAIDEFVDVV